jgi:apolipoprotein N-acyltransferase
VGWSEKWDPARRDTVFRQTLRLAQRATEEHRPDLVVWPEVAVPDYLTLRDGWRRGIATLSRETGVTQAVGALDLEWLDRTERRYDYYNSAFVFDTTGRLVQRPYRKRYLVPVTERVPFLSPRWFDLEFFGGFRAGREAPLYRTALGRFGVLICFESVFENLSRRYRADGADFLVNVTNDAWFGRTSAPYQHAAHVVMRAIETRAAILRSANSGITEFVDPLGHQHQRTSLYERTVVTGEVVTSSVIPLYVRLGDWVGALSLVMTGMMVAAAVTRPS